MILVTEQAYRIGCVKRLEHGPRATQHANVSRDIYIGEGWREVGGRRERRLEQVRKRERKKGREEIIGVERDSNYHVYSHILADSQTGARQ